MSQVTNTTPTLNQHIVGLKSSAGTDSRGRSVTVETGRTWFSWAKDTWLGRIISYAFSYFWSPPEEAPSSLKERVTESPLKSGEYSEYCIYTINHKRPCQQYQTPKELLKDRIEKATSFEELDQIVSEIETTNSVYLSPTEKASLKASTEDLKKRMDILEKSLKQCIYPGEVERPLKEIEKLSTELDALSATDIPLEQIGRLAKLKALTNQVLERVQPRIIDQYNDRIKYANASDSFKEIVSSIKDNKLLSKSQKTNLEKTALETMQVINPYKDSLGTASSLDRLKEIVQSIKVNEHLTCDQKADLIDSAQPAMQRINHYNVRIEEASSSDGLETSISSIISSIRTDRLLSEHQKRMLEKSALGVLEARTINDYEDSFEAHRH